MKPLIWIVTAVGIGATALTIVIGARVKEPTVVANPYEEGLRYDQRRREAATAASVRPERSGRGAAAESKDAAGAESKDGADLSLEISPQPLRAMTELTFTVRAPPGATDVAVSLTMPGMYMGENRVALTPAADGTWRGTGTIVRCPSGGTAWAADVTARGPAGAPLARRFELEVREP